MVKRKRDPNRKSSRHFNLEKPTSKKFNLEKPIGKEFDLEKDVDEGQVQQNVASSSQGDIATKQEKASGTAVGAATVATATAAVAAGASALSGDKVTEVSPALDNEAGATTGSVSVDDNSAKNEVTSQQDTAQPDVEYKPLESGSTAYPSGADSGTNYSAEGKGKSSKGKWLAAAAVIALLGGGGYYFLQGGQSSNENGVDETKIAMTNEEEPSASNVSIDNKDVTDVSPGSDVEKSANADIGNTTDNSSSSQTDKPSSNISDDAITNAEQDYPVNPTTTAKDQGGETGVQAKKQDASSQTSVQNPKNTETESSRNLSNENTRSTNNAQSPKQNPSSVSKTSATSSSGVNSGSASTPSNQSPKPDASTHQQSASVQKPISSQSASNSRVNDNSQGKQVVATIDPASLEHMSSAELEDFARRAIRGEFGNNPERSKILGKAYRKIQNRVNKLMRKNNSR